MNEPLDRKVVVLGTETSPEFAANILASEEKVKGWLKIKDQEIALRAMDNDHNRQTQKANLGWIGILLGAGSEKAASIAFLSIIFSVILLIMVLFQPSSPNSEKISVGCISIITLALGYIFGSHSNSKNDK